MILGGGARSLPSYGKSFPPGQSLQEIDLVFEGLNVDGELYGNVTTAFDGLGCCGLNLPYSVSLKSNI